MYDGRGDSLAFPANRPYGTRREQDNYVGLIVPFDIIVLT